MNKSENPRRRSPSLKIIALAATLAIVFWSPQANAYPLHNDEYRFWPEMPEAAQVLKDIKGTNELDTAARQSAALSVLRELVRVDMDGKGLRYAPARENELDTAYIHALPKGNGYREAMWEESRRLQADPSFVGPFLRRYFSEAAVREVEPVVSSFEAKAKSNANQVNDRTKRVADSQRESMEPKKIEAAGLKPQQQDTKLEKLAEYVIVALVYIYIALTPVFGIQWILRICRAFRTIRTTSDDPPRFEGAWKNQRIQSFTGRVRGSATRSDTTVSGSIRTVTGNPALGIGNRVEGQISSNTTVTDSFRLVDPRIQQEQNFMLKNFNVQLWEDQLVSVAWAIPEHRTDGTVFLVVNHSAPNEIFTGRAALWEVAYPRWIRLFNWGIIAVVLFPLNLGLAIFWAIVMNIQTSRFRQSGIQPLVQTLNRKAEQFS